MSPSTRDFDAIGKLAEYQAVSTVDHILYVEPNEPMVRVWSRSVDGAWAQSRVEGLDGEVQPPALALALPMAEIYARVAFPEPRPALRAG